MVDAGPGVYPHPHIATGSGLLAGPGAVLRPRPAMAPGRGAARFSRGVRCSEAAGGCHCAALVSPGPGDGQDRVKLYGIPGKPGLMVRPVEEENAGDENWGRHVAEPV